MGVSTVRVAASRKPADGDERPPAERLLSAAEHLFGERSYSRTSVAGICARAGMATGSFYAHFHSKADIFVAGIRQLHPHLRAALGGRPAPAGENPGLRVRPALRRVFRTTLRGP